MFSDIGGQITEQQGSVIIDSIFPNITTTGSFTAPSIPSPQIAVNISVQAFDIHLDTGILRYRNATYEDWIVIQMKKTNVGGFISNFTGLIPIQETDIVYWEAIINDSAGNMVVVNDNGQPYTYVTPSLRIEEQLEPPLQLDLSEIDGYTVSFIIPEDANFIDYAVLEYRFNDGEGWHVINMTKVGENIFEYSFDIFPGNATILEYRSVATDIYGNDYTSDDVSVNLIPPLPEWNIPQDQQVIVVLISLMAGLFSGLIYAAIIKRKRPISLNIELVGERKRPKGTYKNINGAIAISGVATASLVTLAIVALQMYTFPEGAMLALAGSFLAAVVLWMLLAARSIMKTMDLNKKKLVGRYLLYFIGISIFAALLAMIFIGNMVPWWRIRLNQSAYNFGGFLVPRMLTTLTSTFFSSIILLTRSISKDVSKVQRELEEAEKLNMNPGWLVQKREKEMSSLMNSVGFKGLIFVTIIGVTIIFASDLSKYAGQGLLILVPFIIGCVGMLIAGAIVQKTRKDKKALIVLDKIISCPECKNETTLSGNFCETCGFKIVYKVRQEEAVPCSQCGTLASKNASLCSYCGMKLVKNT